LGHTRRKVLKQRNDAMRDVPRGGGAGCGVEHSGISVLWENEKYWTPSEERKQGARQGRKFEKVRIVG